MLAEVRRTGLAAAMSTAGEY